MKDLGKFLALILRHKPEKIGITLDEYGYANVDELIAGINKQGKNVTKQEIVEIVKKDNKGRYSWGEGGKIRANQGHSIKVNLELQKKVPNHPLYHGTPEKFVQIILKEGLKPMSRHHVHLSASIDTAIDVARRRGKEVIFEIDYKQMLEDGHYFYLSKNNVWLTDKVPPKYLIILDKYKGKEDVI